MPHWFCNPKVPAATPPPRNIPDLPLNTFWHCCVCFHILEGQHFSKQLYMLLIYLFPRPIPSSRTRAQSPNSFHNKIVDHRVKTLCSVNQRNCPKTEPARWHRVLVVCSRDAANEVCLSGKLDMPTTKGRIDIQINVWKKIISPDLAATYQSKFAISHSEAASAILISWDTMSVTLTKVYLAEFGYGK